MLSYTLKRWSTATANGRPSRAQFFGHLPTQQHNTTSFSRARTVDRPHENPCGPALNLGGKRISNALAVAAAVAAAVATTSTTLMPGEEEGCQDSHRPSDPSVDQLQVALRTVAVITVNNGQFWCPNRVAYGSGVIVESDGLILTCAHVVASAVPKNAEAQVVLNDGMKRKGRVCYFDEKKDIALIQLAAVEGERLNLPTPKLGASERVRHGDPLLVIGTPFGLSGTVTTGVVSSTKREIGEQKYLQIDAPINPGNSGGPVFNAEYDVIGIISAKVRNGEGLGLATLIDDNKEAIARWRDTDRKE